MFFVLSINRLWGVAFITAAAATTCFAQNAAYVDPALCATCHREIAQNYARTGMGRSFQNVQTPLPEFDGKTFHHRASEQYFTPYLRDGKPRLRRHQIAPDGSQINILDAQVDYVFGSGNHARSYLHRTPSGRLIELPLSWYTEKGGYWGMSPAFDRPSHSGFSREITYRCMFCHNAYPEVEPGSDDWDGATRFPVRLPEGIDCQRCHGPGAAHVNAAQRGDSLQRVRTGILNPARLSAERQLEVCMQCHLETTSAKLPAEIMRSGRGVFSYSPAEPLADYILHFDHAPGSGHDDKFELVSSAYRLRKSRCFQSSGGALTCTTCHDPHQARRADFTQACRGCHELAHRERSPAVTECISCHMPRRRPSDTIHLVITDHRIRARPAFEEPRVEMHDGNQPPYRGEVTLYYPRAAPNSELYLALAQVQHQSNLPQGLPRLERAIAQQRPKQSQFYFELGEAYFQSGQTAKAVEYYDQAAKRQPLRWRHLAALGTVDALERAVSLAPYEPAALFGLGQVYSTQGRLQEAVASFRRAIALDPEMVEGPNNLGNTLSRLGDLPGAETALREAVRLRPELPETHVNLANVLVQKGALADARRHLEEAIRIGKPVPDIHTNLGTVLAALGDSEGAVSEYRLAVAADPTSATAHFNLGLTLAGMGQTAEARSCLEAALRRNPNLFEAHLQLAVLLIKQGRAALAIPHLRKAAESPDARVRKAALNRLTGATPSRY